MSSKDFIVTPMEMEYTGYWNEYVNMVGSSISSIEQQFLDIVSPKEGDILVLKVKEPWSTKDLNEFKKDLEGKGISNNLVVLSLGDELSSLTEEEMNKFGWVKKKENRGFEFI